MEKRCINVLGRYDCVRFGLIARVYRTEDENNKFLATYPDVFGETIGCIPAEYDIKVDEDVCPVVHPPRSVAISIARQSERRIKQNGRNWNPKKSDRTNAVGKQYGYC